MAPPCPRSPEFRSREGQDGRHDQGHQRHGHDDPGGPLPVIGNEDGVGEDHGQHADDAALDRAGQPPGVDEVLPGRTCIPRYCPSAKKATTTPNIISSSARSCRNRGSQLPDKASDVRDQQRKDQGVRVDLAFEQARDEDVTDQKDRESDRQHDRRRPQPPLQHVARLIGQGGSAPDGEPLIRRWAARVGFARHGRAGSGSQPWCRDQACAARSNW